MAIFLKFRVSGHNIDFKKLDGVFAGRNIHFCKEGEPYRCECMKEKRYYIEDVFLIDQEYPDEMTVDAAVWDFLSSFQLQQQEISMFAQHYKTMFWIALYPDEYHMNVCISPKTISLLAKFNVELNIESSYLQNFYHEDVK